MASFPVCNLDRTIPGSDAAQPFSGFSERTLLEAGELPIEQLAELALREGQRTNPLYRVHRWFARRLGSQFRAILTGLALGAEDADRFGNLLTPFRSWSLVLILCGWRHEFRGTRRCVARVIGYDINWSRPDHA